MNTSYPGPQPEVEPGIATAEDGLVILDGPDGVAVTMTSDAAARTGQSLIAAARLAEGQKTQAERAEKRAAEQAAKAAAANQAKPTEEELKAARDARYAARKARKSSK